VSQSIPNRQVSDTKPAEITGELARALVEAKRLLDSDPGLTAARAREILSENPGSPEARFLLGAALRRQGDAPGACAILEPLVRLQPRSRLLYFELGRALADDGQHDAAIAAYSRAVELDPRFAEGWRAVGELKFQVGDRAGSEAAFAQAAIVSAGDPVLGKAVAALRDGRLDEAEDTLVGFLETNPDDVRAIKLLGEIALKGERHDDAETLFERCLELAPDFVEARGSYAAALLAANRYDNAIAELEKVLARAPDNVDYRVLMGSALLSSGELERSLAWHERLVSDHPRQLAAWMGYAHTLDATGRTADCVTAYRSAIALCPWFGPAYASVANVKNFRFSDDEIAGMEALLAGSGLGEEDRTALHFALGKTYEDRCAFPLSFEHYARGNALRRAQVDYHPEVMAEFVSISKDFFTPTFFREHAGSGCNRPDPIFIVGMPRSGSTLVEQILASHPAVEALGELGELPRLMRQLHYDYNVEYPEVLALLEPDDLKALGERYLEVTQTSRKLGRPFFTDKAPSNFNDIGLIQLILPRARIIDTRRHPLGCCYSNFRQHFARGQVFSYSLTDLGRCYREYVRLMAHFDSVLPGKIHRIFYEDLIADPEQEVRRLLDYLALPFDPQCLRFHENRRYARTASAQQVRVPIFAGGLDHWQNYEPWLDPLKQELGAVLDAYPNVPPQLGCGDPPPPKIAE